MAAARRTIEGQLHSIHFLLAQFGPSTVSHSSAFSGHFWATQSRERASSSSVGCCIHHLNEIQHGADCGHVDAFPSIPLVRIWWIFMCRNNIHRQKNIETNLAECDPFLLMVHQRTAATRQRQSDRHHIRQTFRIVDRFHLKISKKSLNVDIVDSKFITSTYRMSRSQWPDVCIDLAVGIPQDDVIDILAVILTHNMSVNISGRQKKQTNRNLR